MTISKAMTYFSLFNLSKLFRETVDELFSKVELLNTSGPFRVGDAVVVRVDLYDGYGRARTKGGDDVRFVNIPSLSLHYLDLHLASQ